MQPSSEPFLKAYKSETKQSGIFPYRYLLSTPPSYKDDTTKHWPLLLYLHGSGESHSNNIELAKAHGIPRLVQAYENLKNGKPAPEKTQYRSEPLPEDFEELPPVNLGCAKIVAEQFITLTPQVEPDPKDNSVDWEVKSLSALLDEIEKKYRVDKERIYVTGNSMGGFGAFSLAQEQPERFAAIIPICGGGDPESAIKLKNLPIWVLHGYKDDIVPFHNSEEMVDALKKIEGNVKFTTFTDAWHDCWTETYNMKEIYEWLLLQKKPLRTSTTEIYS